MRASGAIEYITPLQMATESSTVPKSLMNTIVGGYFSACSCVAAKAAHSAKTSSETERTARAIRAERTSFISKVVYVRR